MFISFYEYFIKRIYKMNANLPEVLTLEKSGAATIDPVSFVLHQIDSNILNLDLTLTMKYFDSIMTGQLNQVTSNARQSNESSDDDEPDLKRILIEEARRRRLNQKRHL